MTDYKKTQQLSAEVAAYIAGLVDGEGTITLSRRHANENRQLVISIANTELQILEFVRSAAAVGKITRKKIASMRHTPSFCYAVTNRQALNLLKQITPYLQSYKFHRAMLAMKVYEQVTPRNGKYSVQLLIERGSFEKQFFAIRANSSSQRGR